MTSPWEHVREQLYGADSARYRTLIIGGIGRRHMACFTLAAAGTKCMYTIINDPQRPQEFLGFINGTVEELREFVDYMFQFPDIRGSI
jgi:hypothetical protein